MKFKYGDNVQVIGGFYSGLKGRIYDFRKIETLCVPWEYYISLEITGDICLYTINRIVNEDDLERI